MSNFMRSLKRKQDRNFKQLTPEQMKLPSGRRLSGEGKGQYLTVPLVAVVSMREHENIPLVILAVALLDQTNHSLQGSLQIEFPVYPETESAIVMMLCRYGWVGSMWSPGDVGWPTDTEAEEPTKALLEEVELAATLVFPPSSEGLASPVVEVMRSQGNFLMPHLPRDEEPSPDMLKAFRECVVNYQKFYVRTDATKPRCMGCGAEQDLNTEGPVSLCSNCSDLAKTNARGVKFRPPEEPPTSSNNECSEP